MDETTLRVLLEELKHPDEAVREQATHQLWQGWFQQKGDYGLSILQQSQIALQAGEYLEAETLLTDLIRDQPDFIEAWNRRAVLYYMREQYRKSLADCQAVIELAPFHFGALHGMGLCYAALGNYQLAIRAFRRALEIQPYALINQKLILECTARLS